MNYLFPSVMEATLVFTTIPWRWIRTRMEAATSPSIAMYGVSIDCATELPQKGSSKYDQLFIIGIKFVVQGNNYYFYKIKFQLSTDC